MSLGQNLETALDASPNSRDEIAKAAKTTVSVLSKIIHGHYPNYDLLVRIAHAAGTTVAFLAGGAAAALSPDDDAEMDRHAQWLASKRRREPIPNAEIVSRTARVGRRRVPAGVTLIAQGGDDEVPSRYREADVIARALDDSMLNAGILPGDLLFVKQQRDDVDGKIVLCRIGKRFYAKRLVTENERILLVSDHPHYTPIAAVQKSVEVIGVVLGRAGDVGPALAKGPREIG